jgi:hypothetical protein
VRWMRSRLSRTARETACSTAFGALGSCAIPVFGIVSPGFSRFAILGRWALLVNDAGRVCAQLWSNEQG